MLRLGTQLRNARILLVDDNPINLQMAGSLLQDEGYDIFPCQEARSVLGLTRDIRPDLILLDIMMPGLSGMEVCRNLKALHDTKTSPSFS
ncbi:MAG: response regulator [Blastochloris sp.]|nr:response regulator [Blastochloris sp.]